MGGLPAPACAASHTAAFLAIAQMARRLMTRYTPLTFGLLPASWKTKKHKTCWSIVSSGKQVHSLVTNS